MSVEGLRVPVDVEQELVLELLRLQRDRLELGLLRLVALLAERERRDHRRERRAERAAERGDAAAARRRGVARQLVGEAAQLMRHRAGCARSRTAYSMIFSSGSNGATSLSPSDWMAMWTSSCSGTPAERPCRSR